MIEKNILIEVLSEVAKRAHSEEIINIIKEATLDLDIKKLMQTMIDLHRTVLENMGYDSFEGLLDCMEAIDHYIDDKDIVNLVTTIRKKFGQE